MKNFTTAFVTALTTRNEIAPSKDTQIAISNAKRFENALDGLFGKKAFHAIAAKLISRVEIAEKKDNAQEFIAVKVLVKIVNTAVAISQKNTAQLDPYSLHIIENLISLQAVSNKSALVCLSRSITFTEEDQAVKLVSKYNCSAGTASTQASSTRMMLQALDICEVQKAKRGDVISFKENERAHALASLFVNVEEAETEEEEATETEAE